MLDALNFCAKFFANLEIWPEIFSYRAASSSVVFGSFQVPFGTSDCVVFHEARLTQV